MTSRMRIRPRKCARRFECFECKAEVVSPVRTCISKCPKCGERENFYAMS